MKILGLEEILCLFNVTASCQAAELRLNPGLLTPRPVLLSPGRSAAAALSHVGAAASWFAGRHVSPRGSDCSEAVTMEFPCLLT